MSFQNLLRYYHIITYTSTRQPLSRQIMVVIEKHEAENKCVVGRFYHKNFFIHMRPFTTRLLDRSMTAYESPCSPKSLIALDHIFIACYILPHTSVYQISKESTTFAEYRSNTSLLHCHAI